MPLLEDVRVVVGQLLARADVANCLDPDSAVVNDGIAVRIARVVDEARFVALERRVDHDLVVNRKEKGVVPLACNVGITRVGLRNSEPLPRIFDEPDASRNGTSGKPADALHGRLAKIEPEVWRRGHGKRYRKCSGQALQYRSNYNSICTSQPEFK